MLRASPLILVFEQHSFSSGSQVVEKLIEEQWCQIVGFELPCSWGINDINKFYKEKMQNSGFKNHQLAEVELSKTLENKKQVDMEKLITIRNYFSGKERLKLLQSINANYATAIGLDITLEERNQLNNTNSHLNSTEQFSRTLKSRHSRILKSIMEAPDKSMVCINGIQHAPDIISLLNYKGIPFISCFILDSWAPKEFIKTIDSTYPPKKRSSDGILEFTSVDAAMIKLRELLLPFSIKTYQRLDEPTILTNQLIHKTGLPFFSIYSDSYQVVAVTEISNSENEEQAKTLYKKIGHGSFFSSNNKRYFGLPCINMPNCSDLPKKVSQLK